VRGKEKKSNGSRKQTGTRKRDVKSNRGNPIYGRVILTKSRFRGGGELKTNGGRTKTAVATGSPKKRK